VTSGSTAKARPCEDGLFTAIDSHGLLLDAKGVITAVFIVIATEATNPIADGLYKPSG
jgi:hypothetical protein